VTATPDFGTTCDTWRYRVDGRQPHVVSPLRGEKSGQYLLRPQVLMVRSRRQQQPSDDPYTWVTGHWS
jgi:hypothetical protein